MDEMKDIPTMTMTDKSVGRIQSVSIICTILILSIAPYAVAYGLRVSIYGFTEIFYYFCSLVVLPFFSTIGVACAFLLVQKNTWRTFAVVLGTISLGVCAFVLVQWIKFDVLTIDRIVMSRSWKAIGGSVALVFIVLTVAARAMRSNKRKSLARVLLLLTSLCLGISSFNAFQFLPWFLERGPQLGSLSRYHAEDMLDASAPSFSLQTLHGEKYNFDSDRGKVILLDFWATSCWPCIAELPHVQRLSEEFRNEPITFLAVSTDRDTARVRAFVDSLGYSFHVLYYTDQVMEAYRVSVIPTTFIIDKKGIIRKVNIGFNEKVTGALRRAIRNLLDE